MSSAGHSPLPMKPAGLAGRAFGFLMEKLNERSYRFALDLLALEGDEAVLEIGFGTGRMVELLANATNGHIFGVDPTRTMVQVAQARRAVRMNSKRIALIEAQDHEVDWIGQFVDRIVALHSFQFWPRPKSTARVLYDLLAPGGRIVIVLRDHGDSPPPWLPNPISRQPEEIRLAAALFSGVGFEPKLVEKNGMTALIADKPARSGE
ncbi:MAG: class I SAM-dependent methyltransferase [Sphingomonadales bacterium]|nr:MAG: class I SAM-dependent methyltransferase [Sphingomonadales bacterium]